MEDVQYAAIIRKLDAIGTRIENIAARLENIDARLTRVHSAVDERERAHAQADMLKNAAAHDVGSMIFLDFIKECVIVTRNSADRVARSALHAAYWEYAVQWINSHITYDDVTSEYERAANLLQWRYSLRKFSQAIAVLTRSGTLADVKTYNDGKLRYWSGIRVRSQV